MFSSKDGKLYSKFLLNSYQNTGITVQKFAYALEQLSFLSQLKKGRKRKWQQLVNNT